MNLAGLALTEHRRDPKGKSVAHDAFILLPIRGELQEEVAANGLRESSRNNDDSKSRQSRRVRFARRDGWAKNFVARVAAG